MSSTPRGRRVSVSLPAPRWIEDKNISRPGFGSRAEFSARELASRELREAPRCPAHLLHVRCQLRLPLRLQERDSRTASSRPSAAIWAHRGSI
jgi:hypothetical protein